MKNLILHINTWMMDTFPGANNFLHTASGHIVLFVLIILALLLIRYIFLYPLKRIIKVGLYKRRKKSIYRMLYYRLENVINPLRYLISLYLLKKAMELTTFDGESLDFIFFILFLLVSMWWVYEVVKFALYGYLSIRADNHKSVRRELFNLLLNITKLILAIVSILIVFSEVGVDVSGLITSLGVGGVVLGFSAKDTLTNFFDSVRLVGENAFNLGDWIETEKIEGLVTEVGLVATKIRTFENALVTIPNSTLANGYIKNWSKRIIGRRIRFNLKIKYTYDTAELEKVIAEIKTMLETHKSIMSPKKISHYVRTKQTYKNSLFSTQDTLGVRSSLVVSLEEIGEYSMDIMVYAFSISVNWDEWLSAKQDVLIKVIDIVNSSTLELAIPAEQILLERKE